MIKILDIDGLHLSLDDENLRRWIWDLPIPKKHKIWSIPLMTANGDSYIGTISISFKKLPKKDSNNVK